MPALKRPDQWPTLAPTARDIHWVPAKPAPGRDALVGSYRWIVGNRGRLLRGGLKGVALGLLAASVFAGIIPMQAWWVSDWHWAGGLMVAFGVGGLLGIDAGILLVGIVGLGEASWMATYVTFAHQPLPYISQVTVLVPTSLFINGARVAFAGQVIAATVVVRIVWEGLLSLLER